LSTTPVRQSALAWHTYDGALAMTEVTKPFPEAQAQAVLDACEKLRKQLAHDVRDLQKAHSDAGILADWEGPARNEADAAAQKVRATVEATTSSFVLMKRYVDGLRQVFGKPVP
jgi:predicted ATPase